MIAAISFYLFAAVLIASAVMVVTSRNPVHSVLFLILAFFNAAALFLLAGAEFLAMILVIVYVGAVAVLFLFVVMMLDVDFSAVREGFQRYAPIGGAIGLVLFAELIFVFSSWTFAEDSAGLRLNPMTPGVDNTREIGRILYTDHVWLFQLSGLILLVAMIGAIVLTLRNKPVAKRQNVGEQVSRMGSVNLRQVRSGAGLGELGIERPPVEAPPEPKRVEHQGGGHH
ncbi:NADH-quinone oxidoreductase subunit J [Falsiroseomonas sp. E2-1-a4]|uniref:NADH-quinone oxidoreductase subunit J n=1 Tax=Falsiroseomonas sp. E2-1-a4 TaxID=3239299 RepID=UPI003F2D8278